MSMLTFRRRRFREIAETLHLVSSVGLLNSSSLELTTAIICACVPAYGPIFSHSWEFRLIKRWYTYCLGSFGSSRDAEIQSPPSNGPKLADTHRNTSHWYTIDDGAAEQQSLTCQSSSAKLSERDLNHESFAMVEIQVQDRIEVV